MADTTITITDIITQFGAYYQAGGQGMQSVRQKLFAGFDTANAFTLMPTTDTVIRLSEAETSEVLQPYQDTFTSKGSVVFNPFQLILQQVKVDQAFNPNKLVQSWLGFLTSNNTDRTTWPFIKWFIESYLMNKIQDDMERKVAFKGDYAAPADGTAGNAVDSCDGIKKIINDLVTADKIDTIATGAFAADPADFVTQLEEMYVRDGIGGVDELYLTTPMDVNMSIKNAAKFREGMRKKYNMNYSQADLNSFVDYPNLKVAGRVSHQGSDKIWATPKENAIMGVKGAENQNTFEIEKVDRKVKIYTDWFLGFGYVIPSLVFTNDLDLA